MFLAVFCKYVITELCLFSCNKNAKKLLKKKGIHKVMFFSLLTLISLKRTEWEDHPVPTNPCSSP